MLKRAAVGLIALATLVPAMASAADCDRDCLTGLVTRYVNALVAHKPAQLPVTGDVRFTENSRELALGEGLWKTVTGNSGFRQDYIDVRDQIAAAHVTLLQGKEPVLYSLVLHVRDRRIAGIETLVQIVTPDSRFRPQELGKPLPHFNDPVPAARKDSRDAMIRTALGYPEGLRIGNFTDAPTHFSKEAYRIENGVYTAGVGCARPNCASMYAQKIMLHPDVQASVAAVDEDNDTVLLWLNFGDTGSYGPGNALIALEAFKVWGGEIHAVNAFFTFLPVTTQRGWPSLDARDGPSPVSVEMKFRRADDEQAIEHLLVEYGRTLDARDFAAYAALFAKDGVWKGAQGSYKGPQEIQAAMEKMFNDAAADVPKGKNFHVMSNFQIEVQGDHARANSRFIFYKMDGNTPQAAVAGRYEDELVRVGGVWKFQQRTALPPG
jgi:uncharacterized protein (TIGR02246 family)